MWQHGRFWWNELMTRDVEDAEAFSGEMVGWRVEAMPKKDGGTYWVWKHSATPVGGKTWTLAGRVWRDMPAQWFAYLTVEDVGARVEQARAAGAELMRPIFDVPAAAASRSSRTRPPRAWAGSRRRGSESVKGAR